MRRLAIRPGGIGDSILGFPALAHLALDAGLEVWARREVLPLIGFASAVDSIEGTGLGLLGIGTPPERLVERLRGFDEIVSWYGAGREEFREALGALHPRVIFHAALPVDEEMHAADFFARQVGAAVPALPRIDVKVQASRLIVIHPFSGSAKKNWPLERYLLLGRWLEASGRAVQFVVAPRQVLAGARVVEDLEELGGLLAGAALYVGNDSGITHLAAAAGANVLALFGASCAAVWRPRGERVSVLDVGDLDRLSVDLVLDAALTQTGFDQH